MGATWGTGEGANSGIFSIGARTAGDGTVEGMGRDSFGGGAASVTPLGPQAAKPKAQTTTETSPAKILANETPLFLYPVPIFYYWLKFHTILTSREAY
jgi:hypothetical protein